MGAWMVVWTGTRHNNKRKQTGETIWTMRQAESRHARHTAPRFERGCGRRAVERPWIWVVRHDVGRPQMGKYHHVG